MTDSKRSWNREVYYSQVLEEVHGMLGEDTGEVQGRALAVREAGTGAHPFISIFRWIALEFPG